MNYLLKPQHQQGISISGKSRPSHQSNAIGRALVSITSISNSFCLFPGVQLAVLCALAAQLGQELYGQSRLESRDFWMANAMIIVTERPVH